MRRHQSGFTLIEIAIVLVIIGLLLGGILKGQELITQGRIRNIANDFQSVSVAINLYQDRYKALPGDDNGAIARWTLTASTSTTRGNGVIEGDYNSTTATNESRQFWLHLRSAGLISGAATDDSLPANAASGSTGVQDGGMGLTSLIICSNDLPAKIAQAIDSQLDDGNAITGSVRGQPGVTVSTGAPEENYKDNSNFYVVCKVP